jgi:N-acetylglucosamine-6-phosphate deacetylase
MNNLFSMAKGFAADPKNMKMITDMATPQNLSLVSDALKANKKEQQKLQKEQQKLQKKQQKLQKEQFSLENIAKKLLK